MSRFIYTFILLIHISISVWLGLKLASPEFEKVILSLAAGIAGLSALVFTVAGLWVGIVFPDAIKIIYSGSNLKDKKEQLQEFQSIVLPVLFAIGCAIAMTILPIVYNAIKSDDGTGLCWLQTMSVLTILSGLLLLTSIFKIFLPVLQLLDILYRKVSNEEVANKQLPINQRQED